MERRAYDVWRRTRDVSLLGNGGGGGKRWKNGTDERENEDKEREKRQKVTNEQKSVRKCGEAKKAPHEEREKVTQLG